MKNVILGKGKHKGFWTWRAEDPPALYREPARVDMDGRLKAPMALHRRRRREMKGE